MRLVYISNYFNHHQKTLSDEIDRICESFYFVETNKVSDERKKLGYSEMSAPYVCRDRDLKQDVLKNADIIVIGAAPLDLIKDVKKEKPVLYYSERPFKKQKSILEKFYWSLFWRKRNFGIKRLYMLCSSAYTAADYSEFGLYKNKMYKWGYFPATMKYDLSELFSEKKPAEILWCGRFIDWKHPDDAVEVAKKLKADGVSFRLTFIGTGDMEQELHRMVDEYDLSDRVSFLGSKKPEQVREYMERSGIFMMTSDRKEGWGAVLNEAMNSGCAVVASHLAGSTPYLVDNKKNGAVYLSGDTDDLYRKVRYLLENPDEQKRLGVEAYKTITEEWNAETAADRIVSLAQRILDGEKSPDLYSSGPCSKATVIKDNWFKEEVL